MKIKNLNDLAKHITLQEGLKKSISIAQVKEVLKIIGNLMKKDWRIILLVIKKRK